MSLVLNGINFGPVQCASGAMGWFGEGYWYHKWIPGLDWTGCTLVSKTTTLCRREGNMPFHEGKAISPTAQFQPIERLPKSIVVFPWKGVVLNSIGLSGPGSRALFETGRWQDMTKPFFISFMSVATTQAERIQEAKHFIKQVEEFEVDFHTGFGIQVNLSCPNTGHNWCELASEAKEILELFQEIRRVCKIPIVPKLNVLYPVEAVCVIEKLCDAICVSNTLPWGKLPTRVNWNKYALCSSADPPVSPLYHLGGGGLSGAPLLPLTEEWVRDARGRQVEIPIIAGGGIMAPRDVDRLVNAGANAVFLGSIAILRGWRVRATIRRAHKLLGGANVSA